MDNNNQPQQPQPTSQPPVQPDVSTGSPYQMPQSPKNKKLFIWIGIGVGALLLIGIVAAIIVAMTSVSKDDYRKAYSQMSELSSANSKLNSELSTLQYGLTSATETKFKNDMKSAEEAIEKVRKENEKLAELKAVKVGEGKKQYEEFSEKLENYLKYTEDATKSLKDLYDAAKPCDANVSTSDVAAYKTALNECTSALKKVGNTPNEDVKTYVKSLAAEYENLASIIDKLATITNPYGSQYDEYKALRDQTYKVQENIRNAYTDFRSNIEKHSKEVSVKDQADTLVEFLSEKMRR
jgi:hypothetical protein